MKSLILVVAATLVLGGCSAQASPSGNGPAVSQAAAPSTPAASNAPASAVPTQSPVAGAASSAPVPSGPSIDTGDLSDTADPVVTIIQSLMAALKLPDVDQARTDAGTAEIGLKRVADFVDPVQPGVAKDFSNAASELDQAAPQFPAGLTLVDQAKANLTAGLLLNGAAGCPDQATGKRRPVGVASDGA